MWQVDRHRGPECYGEQTTSIDRIVVPETIKERLRAVWDEVAPRLLRLVAALGIERGRQEDIVQDVYLVAWQKGPPDVDAEQLTSWLFRVAINRCKLEQRRQHTWRGVLRRIADNWRQPTHADNNLAQAEDRELVRNSLKSMDHDLASLLVLRYFMDFDSSEIGRILDQPDSTVRSRLRDARRKLAAELKRAGYRHES